MGRCSEARLSVARSQRLCDRDAKVRPPSDGSDGSTHWIHLDLGFQLGYHMDDPHFHHLGKMMIHIVPKGKIWWIIGSWFSPMKCSIVNCELEVLGGKSTIFNWFKWLVLVRIWNHLRLLISLDHFLSMVNPPNSSFWHTRKCLLLKHFDTPWRSLKWSKIGKMMRRLGSSIQSYFFFLVISMLIVSIWWVFNSPNPMELQKWPCAGGSMPQTSSTTMLRRSSIQEAWKWSEGIGIYWGYKTMTNQWCNRDSWGPLGY